MSRNKVRYRVRLRYPESHIFEISCTVAEPNPLGQHFFMPAWIPGSYLIRDFARNVVRISARAGGRAVAIEKIDKNTWGCAPCTEPLTVTCEVYAWDHSVRGAHLDTTHCYFNGPSVFLAAVGHEDCPCEIDLERPVGPQYGAWRVATAMRRLDAPEGGFGTYVANDYDELIDHPVEAGVFSLARFEACGIPHEIVLTGSHRADLERLCRDLSKLCDYHIRFFAGPAPMERYVFLIAAESEAYGGLEHRASSSLMCRRDDLPYRHQEKVTENYRSFLGLCSHEYFHTWNVKRIKPSAFVPYDLSREIPTRLLWVFEGITSYYDDLALVRCGLITRESYLEVLAQTITRLLRGSGRYKQSVAESSFDAWIKFYKQDENSPNAIVSYYTKGALVALALDLTLRRLTANGRNLDDVMRILWIRHGQPGKGVGDNDVRITINEVAGTDMDEFFRSAVDGTEELPLTDLLHDVGVRLVLRQAQSQDDRGGKSSNSTCGDLTDLGIRFKPEDGGARLIHVLDAGAARVAGLAAGDLIIAVDNIRVNGNLEKMLHSYPVGTEVAVHAFRRNVLFCCQVTLQAAPKDTCVLELINDIDERTKANRDSWLGEH